MVYTGKDGVSMQVRNMALCGLCAALLCLCAWIAVPMGTGMLTMQTFGVFFTLMLLGGKYGAVSVAVYLLLGVLGLPVFSAGQSGLAALTGPTGGFLWGFIGACPVYAGVSGLCKSKLAGGFAGLLLCYLTGSVWYSMFTGAGWGASLLYTVLPFVLPDCAKLFLAASLSKKLNPMAKSIKDGEKFSP